MTEQARRCDFCGGNRASPLADLRGFDLRFVVGVDVGYASTNPAAAEKAHHIDDLALLGKPLGAVFVEEVDRMRRVLRDESHPVGFHLGHNWTMAGR